MAPPSFPTLAEVAPARPAQGDTPATGPIYKVEYSADKDPSLGVATLQENFEKSAKQFANRPCLGFRPIGSDGEAGPYQFLSYQEVADQVASIHAAYEAAGLGPGDKIGVIGQNCIEWMVALQAMNRMNGVCVPLYDTLGDEAVQYICEHAEIKLVTAQGSKLPLLAKVLGKVKGTVTGGVVYWGEAPADAVKAVEKVGLRVQKWGDFMSEGKRSPVQPRPVKATDICTIMYTSGTTGNPKGVVLTHQAVVSTIAAAQAFLAQANESMGPDDVFLSYLTLAHILDRVVEEFILHVGGSIGYFQGDVKKLMNDVDALKPTLFAGVPRVFERIYSGVQEQVHKGGLVKRLVFDYAYWRKLWFMKAGWRYDQASKISDAIVFNKIKQKLGGRVRVILTGGAPISAHVEEFLRVSMCAPLVQGYGLTETCAASFISYPYDFKQVGTVGPPMPHTELRLEAVPELGYDPNSNPPRGEVCIRSKGLFSGYYKNEEMTKEVLDSDGFFHTGDIGELTPTGALKIIDRKKNLFKLSHGEYIAVERLENVYKGSPSVEQIFIYGNSYESCLVAVVVPKEQQLRSLASNAGVPDADSAPYKELLKNDKVMSAVLSELSSTGKSAKVKGFEAIKAVVLEAEAFSVENDLMTPSFKLKRAPLQRRYQKDIDSMYSKLKAAGQA